MTDQELKARVCAEVERCYREAEANRGRDFKRPYVTFALKRRAFGCAFLQRNELSFNMEFLRLDPDHVINVTAAHETAHAIHYALRPQDFKRGSRLVHGAFWRGLMREFGIDEPKRTSKGNAAVVEAVKARPRRRRRAAVNPFARMSTDLAAIFGS